MQSSIPGIIGSLITAHAGHAKQRSGVDILRLLELSVGRVLVNIERRNEGVLPELPQDMSHIADWLAAAVANDSPWLHRLDAEGRPRKLMKFGSMEQIVQEADEAMRKARNHGVADSDITAEIAMTLDNGYRIVRLNTEEELDDESKRMGHCVGDGGYDDGVTAGRTEIHSLRDRFGKSHLTIETVGGRVYQIKGKGNKGPAPQYFAMLADWFEATERTMATGDLPEIENGWAMTVHGRLVDLRTLEAGQTIRAHVTVGLGDGGLSEFPIADGVRIDGYLRIHASRKYRLDLPAGFEVAGNVHIEGGYWDSDRLPGTEIAFVGTRIARLPATVTQPITFMEPVFNPAHFDNAVTVFEKDVRLSRVKAPGLLQNWRFGAGLSLSDADCDIGHHLVVPGDLRIESSVVKPSGSVDVGGSLSVAYCDDGKGPGTMRVGRDLSYQRSDMHASSIEVGGHLTYDHSNIRRGPDRLRVGGNLLYSQCNMRTMPADTVVGGSLSIYRGTGVDVIPASVVVGGDIDLNDCKVKSLDGRTEFKGYLKLIRTAITELADGLTVAGDLSLSDNPTERLPDGTKVGGSVFVKGAHPRALPPGMTVGENVVFKKAAAIALPDGFVVRGSLDIEGVKEVHLPEDLYVEDTVLAVQSGLKTVPKGANFGALHAAWSQLEELPEGFVLRKGDLDIGGTPMKTLPEYLSVQGTLRAVDTAVEQLPATAYVGGSTLLENNDLDQLVEEVVARAARRMG